jgi:hypothetical protein
MITPAWASPLIAHTPNLLMSWAEPRAGLVYLVVYASIAVREHMAVYQPVRGLIEECGGAVVSVADGIRDLDMLTGRCRQTVYKVSRPEVLERWLGRAIA